MNTNGSKLHESLAHLRADAGLSFQQLSERSRVNVGYLHSLETGRAAHPSRNILLCIAIGLNLDVDEVGELLTAAGHLPLLRGSSSPALAPVAEAPKPGQR